MLNRRPLAVMLSFLIAVAGTLTIVPNQVAAACVPEEECFPEDLNDPWWEENCWEDPEEGTCCHCADTGIISCVKVGG
jgi:hypothetical protein